MKAKIKMQSKSDWTDWDQKRLLRDVEYNNTKISFSSACQKLEAHGRGRMNLNLPFFLHISWSICSHWLPETAFWVIWSDPSGCFQVCIQMMSSEVALGSCSKQKWCRKAWIQQRQFTILPQPWLVCGLRGTTAHPWVSAINLMGLVSKHNKNLSLPDFVWWLAF